MKLALMHSGQSTLSPSSTNYVQRLQELSRAKAELDTALQAQHVFLELLTYLTVAIGQSNNVIENLEKHCNECRKEIEACSSTCTQFIMFGTIASVTCTLHVIPTGEERFGIKC